ncbi:HslU--HslV peptidase ATPase subunit, partial [Enterococcus lactis]
MMNHFNDSQHNNAEPQQEVTEDIRINSRKILEQLQKGLQDNREVTIQVEYQNKQQQMNNNGFEQMGIDQNETLGDLKAKKKVERT